MLTRRDLLGRVSRLVPLAAAAGMLGRLAGPAQGTILGMEAVAQHPALVGFVDDLPVYDFGLVSVGEDEAGMAQLVLRVPGESDAANAGESVLVWRPDGQIERWFANDFPQHLPDAAARFTKISRIFDESLP